MSADKNKFGSSFRDSIIVGVFGTIFASIFFASGQFIYGLWCSFIGLAGFVHIPAQDLSKAKPRKKTYVWITYWSLLFLIALWFSVWSYKIKQRESHILASSKPVEATENSITPTLVPEWQSQTSNSLVTEDKQMQILQELDDPIRRIFLILRLSGTNNFAELIPFHGVLELWMNPDSEGGTFEFKDYSGRNGMGQSLVGYEVKPKLGEVTGETQDFAFMYSETADLDIPIPAWSIKEFPFKKFRDFNSCSIALSISSNLVAKLNRVEFVVNGWGLFNAEIKDMRWQTNGSDCVLLARVEPTVPKYRAAIDLSIHNKTMPFYTNLSGPTILGDDAFFQTIPKDEANFRWRP